MSMLAHLDEHMIDRFLQNLEEVDMITSVICNVILPFSRLFSPANSPCVFVQADVFTEWSPDLEREDRIKTPTFHEIPGRYSKTWDILKLEEYMWNRTGLKFRTSIFLSFFWFFLFEFEIEKNTVESAQLDILDPIENQTNGPNDEREALVDSEAIDVSKFEFYSETFWNSTLEMYRIGKKCEIRVSKPCEIPCVLEIKLNIFKGILHLHICLIACNYAADFFWISQVQYDEWGAEKDVKIETGEDRERKRNEEGFSTTKSGFFTRR